MDINIAFTREVLRLTMIEVRAAHPELKVKDAWVWKFGKDHWEFHFNDFYWYGSADNAYEARAKGWQAFMDKAAGV